MDSLTHLLVGHAMGTGAASAAGPHGTAAYWGILIGNSLPDIDVPISLIFRRDIKLHRTITHTIPGALVLSAITALIVRFMVPGAPPSVAFGYTFLGCLVHMGMDCLNLFGARPFWPVSSRSIDLGILHILDPILLVLLGIPTIGVWLGIAKPSLLTLAFVLMWPYILYRITTARRLFYTLKREGSLRARVVPWYTGWRFIFESSTTIEFGCWTRGKRRVLQAFPKQDSALIRATMEDPEVSAFLKTAEYPYAIVQEDEKGPAVVWGDALRRLRADFRPLWIRVGQ